MSKLIKLLEECAQLATDLERINDRLAEIKEVNNIVEALLIL